MQIDLPESSVTQTRRLNLGSIPGRQMGVVNMILDLTLQCNLRCRYCYKEKGNNEMSLRTAQDAVIWLLYASGSAEKVTVFFMGGEPFLRLELMEKLIPFAKQRAKAHQKQISFGVTTNGTLVTDEVVDFANRVGLGFHLSVDGVPSVQNYNRPLMTGADSSPLVEQAAARMLEKQPNVMSRGCVSPDNVTHLLDSFLYFRSLGFTTIGLYPCESGRWTEETLNELEKQYESIGEQWIQAFRSSFFLNVSPLNRLFTQKDRTERGTVPCGSGRGMVSIDTEGGIWACTRFSSHKKETWQLGSIYGDFSDEKRQLFLTGCTADKFYSECVDCAARQICDGGCLVENLEIAGDPYRTSLNECQIYRILARVGTKVHDILYGEKNPLFMEKYYPQEWKKHEKENNNDIPNEPCPA